MIHYFKQIIKNLQVIINNKFATQIILTWKAKLVIITHIKFLNYCLPKICPHLNNKNQELINRFNNSYLVHQIIHIIKS